MQMYYANVLLEEYGAQAAVFFQQAGVEMPLLAALEAEEKEGFEVLNTAGTPAMFIETQNISIIMAVPELFKALDKRKPIARAVVAHELGHAFHQHMQKGLKTITLPNGTKVIEDNEAEMQADAFAKKIGLGEPLRKFLEDYKGIISEVEMPDISKKEKALKDLEVRIKALSQ